MSIGYGAACRKVSEDSECVLYEYYSYDLNRENTRNSEKNYDGLMLLQKKSLAEPHISMKIKRMPNGKKKTIVKRIPVEVDIAPLLLNGNIEIKNSSYAWYFVAGVDVMAIKLCRKLFRTYQESGELPDHCGYHV